MVSIKNLRVTPVPKFWFGKPPRKPPDPKLSPFLLPSMFLMLEIIIETSSHKKNMRQNKKNSTQILGPITMHFRDTSVSGFLSRTSIFSFLKTTKISLLPLLKLGSVKKQEIPLRNEIQTRCDFTRMISSKCSIVFSANNCCSLAVIKPVNITYGTINNCCGRKTRNAVK